MIPAKLKEVKEKLDKKEKVDAVTVREFVSWFWGSERRGSFIVWTIKNSLNEVELVTEPDFESAYIDSFIEFKKVPEISKKTARQKNK